MQTWVIYHTLSTDAILCQMDTMIGAYTKGVSDLHILELYKVHVIINMYIYMYMYITNICE